MAGNDKEVIAKVGVDVEPKLDTKKLKEQLGEIVKQGNLNDKKITIGSKLDLTGLKDSLEKVPSQVNLNNKSVTIKSKLDLTGLTDALNKISSQPNFNNKNITVGVKLDTSKIKESVDKLATNKLLNSKKITVGANLDLTKIKNSIKDINKTKLNIPVDLTNLKEVARQLSIIRNLVRGKHNGINNIPLDIKGGVSSRSSKRRKSDDSPLDIGFKKGGTPSDVDSEYKSLLQKRKEAFNRADKAWQESKSKNTPNYNKARQEFIEANKEYVEFGQQTGKLSLSGLIKQYENMLGSNLGKNNPIREEIERLWKDAIKRQDELAKELASKNPLNQRKESEKGREAVIKEAYAQDKHTTDLLTAQAKAQANAIKEAFKQQAFSAKEMSSGQIAKSLAMDLNNAFKSGDQSAIKEYTDRFRQAMQEYVSSKNNLSANAEANLYKNMARHLKDASPVFDELIAKARQLKQVEKEIQEKIGVSTRGGNGFGQGGSGGGNASTAQTFAAEAKRYAAEAEKAWRDAGNKSTPEFEKLRKQFMDTMNQMVRFRREIGDLSAGQAAGVYSKMASSLGKLSPLYDGLIKKARELNKEQARVNADAKDNADHSRGRWFGGVATYLTHFLGRSSKGWGSFGEAVADLAAKLQSAGGAVGRFGTALAGGSALFATIFAAGGLVVMAFNMVQSAVTFFGGILQQIGTTIYNVLKPGIELYKQQTSAMFSLTASLKSNAKYFKDKDSAGELLTTPEARGLSRDLIYRATLDAEMSAFSLEELLRSLQGTLPILLSKGFSLDQAYEINRGVAGVSKMIQLTPSQILQETRDLAQGSITSRGSQVANALGISNADIAKYKGNVDELFDYLMGKFKEYSELLNSYENTALGRWQQLEERWQTVTKTMVEGIETRFQALFEELINMTGSWVDRAGNKLNAITGKWEDKYGNVYDDKKKKFYDKDGNEVVKKPEELANVGKGYKFELSDPLKDALKVLKELVDFTLNLVAKFKEFVSEASNGKEPIEVIKDTIETIEILFEWILEKIVGFCIKLVEADEDGNNLFLTLYNGANAFYSVLEDVYNRVALIYLTIKKWSIAIEAAGVALGLLLTTGGVGNVVTKGAGILSKLAPIAANSKLGKMAVSGVEKVSSKIGDLTGWWSSASKTQKIGAGMAGAGAGAGIYEVFFGEDDDEKLEKEITELKDKIDHKLPYQPVRSMDEFRARASGGEWETSKRLRERREQLEKEKEALKNDPTRNSRAVKGTPPNTEDEKARKKAIQLDQKRLKDHLSNLKEILQDSLDRLKGLLEKNEVSYKEGFTGLKEYLERKTELERQQAELELKYAQDEMKAIQETMFNTPYEKSKAEHDTQRKIDKYTKALGKTINTQEAVRRDLGNFTRAFTTASNGLLRVLTGNNNIGGVAQLQPGVQAGNSVGDWQDFGDSLVNIAMYVSRKTGIDAKLLWAQMMHETGGDYKNQNKYYDHNYSGISVFDGAYNSQGLQRMARPSSEGGWYERYGSDKEFAEAFIKVLMQDRYQKTGGIANMGDASSYAHALKVGGYYTDLESNYASSLSSWLKQAPDFSKFNSAIQSSVDGLGQQVGVQLTTSITGALELALGKDGGNLLYKQMPHLTEGCVEAVVTLGSYFNDLLLAEAKKGTNNVDVLTKNLKEAGVQYEDYTPGQTILQPGDVLVNNNGNHVMLVLDKDHVVGNSSTISNPVYGGISGIVKDELAGWHTNTAVGVLRTGTTGVNLGGSAMLLEAAHLSKEEMENFNLMQELLNKYNDVVSSINDEIFGNMPMLEVKLRSLFEQLHKVSRSKEPQDVAMADALRTRIRQETNKIVTDALNKQLDFNLSRISTTGSYLATEIAYGKNSYLDIPYDKMADKYYDFLFNPTNFDELKSNIANTKSLVNILDNPEKFYDSYMDINNKLWDLINKNNKVWGEYTGRLGNIQIYENELQEMRNSGASVEDINSQIAKIAKEKQDLDKFISDTSNAGVIDSIKNLESQHNKLKQILSDNGLSKDSIESSSELYKQWKKANDELWEMMNVEGKNGTTEQINAKLEEVKSLLNQYNASKTDIDTARNRLKNELANLETELNLAKQRPANQIEELSKQFVEATNLGNTNLAEEIRGKLIDSYNKLKAVYDSWISAINSRFDAMKEYFDILPMTNLQRERGEEELTAYRNQQLAIGYRANLSKYRQRLSEIQSTNNANKTELASLQDSGLPESAERIKYLGAEIARTNEEERYWNQTIIETKQRLRISEELAKLPPLLEKTRRVAKQALEDGLVTFLTDGVNEAENLGEALRNLAIDFLKTMQQFFAKQMVTSLMNHWFPVKTGDTDEHVSTLNLAPGEYKQIVTIPIVTAIDRQTAQLLGRSVSSVATGAVSSALVPGNNMLNLSYDEYMENKANPYKFNPSDYEISGSAVAFKSSIDEFKLSNTELINANMANTAATTAGTAVEQTSVALDTAAKITNQESNVLTAENNAKLANVSAQLSSVTVGSAHASGGYITGPGTGTSDSIPARLSAGEYVIKAEAVKRMGVNYLNAINNGNFTKIRTGVHHYAQGGLVSDLAQEQTARGISNFGKDISNNISNTANISVALVRDEQEGMKQLLKSPEGQRIMLDFSRKYASVTSRF